MARNEDAIRRRIEQRIAYVQANPDISKAQAREQFYVQTRAAELEAQGQEVNRAALRQKFRSGQVSREGFYVQGEQERLQARAAARVNNEVSSNTGIVPPPGQFSRPIDNVRGGTYGGDAVTRKYGVSEGGLRAGATPSEIARYEASNTQAASRSGMQSYYDAYGNLRYREKGVKGSIAEASNKLGSYLNVQIVDPAVEIAKATAGSGIRVQQEISNINMGKRAINLVGGLFGQNPNLEVKTPTPVDYLTVASLFAGGRGGRGAYTTATGPAVTAAELAAARGPFASRLANKPVTRTLVKASEQVRASISGTIKGKKPKVTTPTTPFGELPMPSNQWYGRFADDAAGAATPPAANVGAAPTGPSRPTSSFYDDLANPTPTAATPSAAPSRATTPTPTAQPGSAASQAIDELRATTQKLIDEANAPTPTPSRGKGGRGSKPKKTETTSPAANAADDAAQAQLQAGKAKLKELKKELSEARKMKDEDGAAGVVDQIQRDIAKVEADLSKLKTNLGRPAKATTETAPAPMVTSNTGGRRVVWQGREIEIPAGTPARHPFEVQAGVSPAQATGRAPVQTPTAGTRGGRSGRGTTSKSTTPATETVPPAKTTAAQPETAAPASRSGRRSTSRATDDTPRTTNVSDEATLDVMWQWAKENAPARKAGTLGPRPAEWRPPSQRGIDIDLPKNEPVSIEIEPSRAEFLARREAESIATQRQAGQQFREAERLRAQAGNLRTQQRGSRTTYRNLDERLRALQDDLAASGGADPLIQKKIERVQKQIAAERTKRAQTLVQQRTTQAQARQAETQARQLQEQRIEYVGKPSGGARIEQTQARTKTAVAEEARTSNTSKWFDDEGILDPYAEN